MIVNGISARFADVFTVRGIKKNTIDDKAENLLLCAQCKLYSADTKLKKTDVEDEIKKIRGTLESHLPRYNSRWLLVVYTTRVLDFQIKEPKCIILDSFGMERHFGPTLVERAFYLLEHRKVNANYFDVYELQQANGIGNKYASCIVKERENGPYENWKDLKSRVSKLPKNLEDRFEY